MPRLLFLATVFLLAPGWSAPPQEVDADEVEFFERKIRPVLVEHCYACHSVESSTRKKLRGGLKLDSREGLLRGGDGGPAVEPGKPDESLLITALRHVDDLRMPPKGKLPDEVVADFVAWVQRGAADPRSEPSPPARDVEKAPPAGRDHWAYQPPVDAPPPPVRDASWPAGAIDQFLLARLEAAGLRPAAEADRAALIRRLSFDLTGLPPTPEEIDSFIHDPAPVAYERLVDRLLGSPHFGERWGRHWLDVARFGESLTLRGLVLKEAWRYRDYVIDAFNADLPFDQFLREQIAGDLLPAGGLESQRRRRIAVTFLLLGNTNLEEQDKAQLEMDFVDEQIDVIGKAILAQTIACARCHDHKFDPIPTADYYALAGILHNAKALKHDNVSKWIEAPLPTSPEREAAVAPRRDMAMSLVESSAITEGRILVRGSVHSPGEPVRRGWLRAASRGAPPSFPSDQSGRRELADWLASADNPLTARVIANRAWHWLFGAGLVRTTDNFGTTGEAPTHPELLDWLAIRFVEDGWSTKSLVRRIVLSRTYRLASVDAPSGRAIDPENRLLGRANRRRLDAECLRDAMLSASGRLRYEMGGRSFPPDLAADYGFQSRDSRRGVYEPVFRNALPDLFTVFDFADPSMVVGRRDASIVAPQALFLMNNPFVLEQARHAARRLLAESAADDSDRLDAAYLRVLGRAPTESERRITLDFLARASAEDDEEAWSHVVHALFESADFRSL
ncbi:MAG: PSD1 and planctomycete cytochrome C domain-containing protein [Paludisphaera borealis]|uniref:PSD1 and planctomycete cytochrome C domain-containing protein n=1 Tax=Paludisphaera borealis TaxID=1387353 RepID=UPI0028438DD5|nr:PSD1 and planctomycete cytochrome C domain-containing protein [Paludisphaera borealis]MDR3622720.1 PSD1 and planctomycete cytochrome C domain-containing protein [Paludisphaera borealis]